MQQVKALKRAVHFLPRSQQADHLQSNTKSNKQ